MSREIYLDNSATTRPYDEVIDFVNHISREVYGNPSSLHTKGIEAERMVRNAREIVAKSLECQGMRFILLPAEPRQTTLPLQDTFLQIQGRESTLSRQRLSILLSWRS